MVYGKDIFNNSGELEKIACLENIQKEVIEALRQNVFIVYKDVVCYKEVPVPSPLSVNVLFDEFVRIAEPLKTYAMLIDVSNARRPDAKLRLVIDARMNNLPGEIFHCAYITGKNPIINTAIRFLMFRSRLQSFSINRTKEIAIKKIENARR